MKLHLLIVENSSPQARGIARVLRQIPEAVLSRHGITELVIEFASSETAALRLLMGRDRPFDVALLDLGLPKEDGDPDEDSSRGQHVLRVGMQLGAIRSALVISAFHGPEDVLRAFQGGALNFLFKGYTDGKLVELVLDCWDRRTRQLSNDILMERLKSLLQYAEAGLSNGLGTIFTDCVREVLRDMESLEFEIASRQGLDPGRDADDPLIIRLGRVRDAIRRHQANWEDAKARWPVIGEMKAVELAAELAAVHERIAPCLMIKNVEVIWPEADAILVNCFGQEARDLLAELFLGALAELTDGAQPEPVRFQVRVAANPDSGRVAVTVDSLPALDAETAARINRGLSAAGVAKFSRGWGLSVMQQVALRGGGRLEVEPLSSGSRIIYHLPLA